MSGKTLTLEEHYRGFCDMICRGCGESSDTIRCNGCWDKLYEEITRPFSRPFGEEKKEAGEASFIEESQDTPEE